MDTNVRDIFQKDIQDIFQPERVTPELVRYLGVLQRRRVLEEQEAREEIWDFLGDFA